MSGDKLIEEIELASGKAMMGLTQRQFIDSDGDRLVLESKSMATPVGVDGRSEK